VEAADQAAATAQSAATMSLKGVRLRAVFGGLLVRAAELLLFRMKAIACMNLPFFLLRPSLEPIVFSVTNGCHEPSRRSREIAEL
jgi:hypothetical protein